jgi:hypothetical protein
VALGAAGSSLQLLGNYVEGPGWLDERRPDALEWADNAVNDSMLLNKSGHFAGYFHTQARAAEGHRECPLEEAIRTRRPLHRRH